MKTFQVLFFGILMLGMLYVTAMVIAAVTPYLVLTFVVIIIYQGVKQKYFPTRLEPGKVMIDQ